MRRLGQRGFTLIELMIVIGIIALLLGIVVPNFLSMRARSQLTSCQSTLKSLGTAVELYGTENQGHFPPSLSTLTPNYIKSIPTCAAVGSDTYSADFTSLQNPDRFTIICGTLGHAAAGVTVANYPQYSSYQGLVEHP